MIFDEDWIKISARKPNPGSWVWLSGPAVYGCYKWDQQNPWGALLWQYVSRQPCNPLDIKTLEANEWFLRTLGQHDDAERLHKAIIVFKKVEREAMEKIAVRKRKRNRKLKRLRDRIAELESELHEANRRLR